LGEKTEGLKKKREALPTRRGGVERGKLKKRKHQQACLRRGKGGRVIHYRQKERTGRIVFKRRRGGRKVAGGDEHDVCRIPRVQREVHFA